ncbi:hypothetical protein C6501_14685 [Candidatus Poribacteria bacterium]|nr:MAG: hypothetical protein C6501_14685 [Candidatus Poribacteria bacterium]
MEYLFAYPVNPIIETAAKLDIRIIIVRQEREQLSPFWHCEIPQCVNKFRFYLSYLIISLWQLRFRRCSNLSQQRKFKFPSFNMSDQTNLTVVTKEF